jgi:hypothetical protein
MNVEFILLQEFIRTFLIAKHTAGLMKTTGTQKDIHFLFS